MQLTSHNKPQETDQRRIPQIKQTPSQRAETQSPRPIKQTISKNVPGASATAGESSPLPVVILRAKHKIYRHDGDGCARDDEEDEAEEEEAEHVVDPRTPEGIHDEEEFDEDCAKREEAGQK